MKIKPKFEDYKKYLEQTQFLNKTNQLEKNEIDVDSFK